MGLRERRSQQWCRTEDVRTIKEGDMNTDKWTIETPPGISKQECNEDKLETRVTKLEEQTKWMYDGMTAAAAESSTWNRGIPWRYEDNGDEWQRWEGSWWIRVNQDDFELSPKEEDIKESEEDGLTVKRMGWPGYFKN